ncbi:hypothetical protein ORV05_14060 [Amycolatopsis cynarae]|uniref:Sodium/calcium exchanger membrane region domain-containing protein n=1 Tax=Amycolatopsis cynarae TaxID=2995223 RepID=A0ABY7BD52_9PSEU|nr:hypothetical protein [Amycolatopsis sp. HUAS 11-8]WAL68836.1 hypothetical protein ORV05_14060 [Amycolatopsis sp. HUAS 11-8]
MWHFVVLVVCAAAIYFSCEWFVNAVEWLGQRLNVGRMAVGTILAAFATYALYFWREIRSGGGESGENELLAPLKFQPRRTSPATWAVVAQTLATLAVIFAASQLFVHQLDAIGPMLGLSGAVTALLLSPIATELPEIMNAIIWVRQGKTSLALANISGAMMIQATVPSGLGLLFTPWRFNGALLWAGIVTMIAIAYLLATLRAHKLTPARLALAAGLYLVFAAGLVPILTQHKRSPLRRRSLFTRSQDAVVRAGRVASDLARACRVSDHLRRRPSIPRGRCRAAARTRPPGSSQH